MGAALKGNVFCKFIRAVQYHLVWPARKNDIHDSNKLLINKNLSRNMLIYVTNIYILGFQPQF